MANESYAPERRPLASRQRAASKVAAHWLAARGASPNAISLAGMGAGIGAGVALAVASYSLPGRLAFLAAAILIQLRLLANMLDGMVALERGKASPTGELFNEVPDRVSDAAMFIGAGYAAGGNPTLGYVAACLALFLAYLRAQGKVVGAHQEFCGPMAKPQRAFAMTVVSLCCMLAPADWKTNIAIAPGWGIVAWGLAVLIVGEVWTVGRRLQRIADRLREQKR